MITIKCYEMIRSTIYEGIGVQKRSDSVLEEYAIYLGESGRNRRLVEIPVNRLTNPKVEDKRLKSVDVNEMAGVFKTPESVLLVIRDQSGYRGTWKYEITNGTVISEGWKAEGIAGRMGGGPETMIALNDGGVIMIKRYGRLYGSASEYRIENKHGSLVVVNTQQEKFTESALQFLDSNISTESESGLK